MNTVQPSNSIIMQGMLHAMTTVVMVFPYHLLQGRLLKFDDPIKIPWRRTDRLRCVNEPSLLAVYLFLRVLLDGRTLIMTRQSGRSLAPFLRSTQRFLDDNPCGLLIRCIYTWI